MNQLKLLCFLGIVLGGATQSTFILQGDETHSPASTVHAMFSATVLSGRAQTIVWKFNNTNVCYIPIPFGSIDSPYCSSATDNTYYNRNSAVSPLLISGVLYANFTYSNIQAEDYDIILSVYDVTNDILYNTTSLAVNVCPMQSNSVNTLDASSPSYCNPDYNYYNCTTSFACKDGFSGASVDATCLENATWSNDISCSYETTTAVESTTAESTTVETSTTKNSPVTEGGTPEAKCLCENNEPTYYGEQPADAPVITFSVLLGVGVIVVIILIWKIGLKKCIVIIWVALFYTISFILIIVGIILTAVYKDNCCGNNTERYIGIACGIIGIIGCAVGITLHIIGILKNAAFLYCCCCRADAKDNDESTYSCVCGGKVLCKCGCSKSSGTCCCCCIVTE